MASRMIQNKIQLNSSLFRRTILCTPPLMLLLKLTKSYKTISQTNYKYFSINKLTIMINIIGINHSKDIITTNHSITKIKLNQASSCFSVNSIISNLQLQSSSFWMCLNITSWEYMHISTHMHWIKNTNYFNKL